MNAVSVKQQFSSLHLFIHTFMHRVFPSIVCCRYKCCMDNENTCFITFQTANTHLTACILRFCHHVLLPTYFSATLAFKEATDMPRCRRLPPQKEAESGGRGRSRRGQDEPAQGDLSESRGAAESFLPQPAVLF